MTKEQAIEILKKVITTKFNNDYSINNVDKEAIETVLSMLEEQDKISRLENIIKFQSKDIKETVDYTFELNKEIELEDKIIDLMSEDIYNYQIECNRYFKDKEEVKQYFENKAKEEK